MCIINMLFYTAFITKEHVQIFGEMVQKVLKMRKYNLFFTVASEQSLTDRKTITFKTMETVYKLFALRYVFNKNIFPLDVFYKYKLIRSLISNK